MRRFKTNKKYVLKNSRYRLRTKDTSGLREESEALLNRRLRRRANLVKRANDTRESMPNPVLNTMGKGVNATEAQNRRSIMAELLVGHRNEGDKAGARKLRKDKASREWLGLGRKPTTTSVPIVNNTAAKPAKDIPPRVSGIPRWNSK